MQRIDFLVKGNEKDTRTDSLIEKMEERQAPLLSESHESLVKKGQKTVLLDKFDFFTGFAWCQALIFKSWLEASDKLVRLQSEMVEKKEISSLYVDVHEEVFTNLFKSQLYASSLGRMINASMLILKNWQTLHQNPNPENHLNKDTR